MEGKCRVPGKVLFTLYDTYGFPIDLAEEVLKDHGFALTPETQAEYDQEMEAQRERARASATFGTGGAARAGDGAPPIRRSRRSYRGPSSSATRGSLRPRTSSPWSGVAGVGARRWQGTRSR